MPNPRPNFLLGNGHRLTSPITISKMGGVKEPPYSFKEAQERLGKQFAAGAKALSELPPEACPDGYSVGIITLHPEYTAKSYFPATLLRAARMEAIGSRPASIKPEKGKKSADPKKSPTTELFVAARVEDFESFSSQLPTWTEKQKGAEELVEIEAFRAPRESDHVQKINKKDDCLLEIVLHTSGIPKPRRILEAFEAFSKSLDLQPDMERRFEVGNLCFLPLQAPLPIIQQLSQFSFLRTIREMPGLRPLNPIIRTSARIRTFPVSLPATQPLDSQLRAAVFDGGLTEKSSFSPFAIGHEPAGIGPAVDEYVDHGTAVTSAVLFGPISNGVPLPQPYGSVDHYRVIDNDSDKDPFELYDALGRIRDVLQSRRHSFINLSIGPDLLIEDYEVHAWTSVLDSLLSDGDVLATIAVGNEGERDHGSGNARVRVPSDSVNSLAVGSSNSRGNSWSRASYSCIGPGRSPGLIKPEVVAFGGWHDEPFFVLDATLSNAIPNAGTSFASPFALRMGMGVRAHFGSTLSPLAIKALLVHCAEPHKRLPIREIGWGRLPENLETFVVCPEGEARVVYQGELTPGQYLRTPIPLPSSGLDGMIELKATFCYACKTDPNDPSNYTQGGLDIIFRPHSGKFINGSAHPKSGEFFRRSDFDTERELRRDAHKWETTLHRSKSFRSSSLNDPVFDVHYQVRESGRATTGEKIRYALIITISAPKTKSLYDKIVQRYQTQLEPIRPVVEIPIST